MFSVSILRKAPAEQIDFVVYTICVNLPPSILQVRVPRLQSCLKQQFWERSVFELELPALL